MTKLRVVAQEDIQEVVDKTWEEEEKKVQKVTIEVTGYPVSPMETESAVYVAKIVGLTGESPYSLHQLEDFGVQLTVEAPSAGKALQIMGQNFDKAGFLE